MSNEEDIRNESFGVFKPVGHVVASFPDAAAVTAAEGELRESGLASDGAGLRRIGPAEMEGLAEAELANASPLAWFGYEINLVKAYQHLAQRGCHFLVIKTESEDAARVAAIAQRHGAEQAQRFGTLTIEELIDLPAAERAVSRPDFGGKSP